LEEIEVHLVLPFETQAPLSTRIKQVDVRMISEHTFGQKSRKKIFKQVFKV
jgi:hypothetical protein